MGPVRAVMRWGTMAEYRKLEKVSDVGADAGNASPGARAPVDGQALA
jgi:hypothetical protein